MVGRLTLASAIVAASLVFLVSSASALSEGKLDRSFSGDGVATTAAGLGEGSGNGVFVQPDSKIVVVGSYWRESRSYVEIARFLPDGTPDPSFGTLGRVDTSAITPSVYIHGGALNADGTILAVGRTSIDEEWVVVRVTASGALDTSFNGSGWLSRSVNSYSGVPYSALTQSGSGRVIVAGIAFGIARSALLAVKKDGSPITDDSWGDPGQNGAVLPDISPGLSSKLLSIFELPDRNLLSVGWAETAGGGTAVGAVRLLPGGQLDTKFGSGGVAVVPLPGQQISGAAMDGRGRMLVSSTASVLNGALSVSRLTTTGKLDRSFGKKGTASLPSGTSAGSVAVAPDGRIVVAGGRANGEASTFLLARFTENGQLDKSFGKGGTAQKYFAIGQMDKAVLVQKDGKIVSVGSAKNDITLARFLGVSDQPASKIASPNKSTLRRGAFTEISGKASPGSAVTKVEVAIRRIDSKQLRKKRCLWVNSKSKVEKVKDTKRKCAKQVWLKASGLKSWSYKFKKLPAGTYRIYSRATINLGVTETKFSARRGNFRTLTLKK